jgi:hypothetical protein
MWKTLKTLENIMFLVFYAQTFLTIDRSKLKSFAQ